MDKDWQPPAGPAWYREGQQFWDSFPPNRADFKALEARLARIEAVISKLSATE